MLDNEKESDDFDQEKELKNINEVFKLLKDIASSLKGQTHIDGFVAFFG